VLVPRPCPVTKGAFERLKEGMTQAEVEKVLGGPPGDYTTRPEHVSDVTIIGSLLPNLDPISDTSLFWLGDEGKVTVGFSRGVVVEKEFWERTSAGVNLFELFRWRFDRWRERTFETGP
jgi:hypothetical protein